MAEKVISAINTPTTITCSSTPGQRRRVVMPDRPHTTIFLYHASAVLYYEPVDADDESATGSGIETIPAGTQWSRLVGRGEFALSSDTADAAVEATVVEGIGL